MNCFICGRFEQAEPYRFAIGEPGEEVLRSEATQKLDPKSLPTGRQAVGRANEKHLFYIGVFLWTEWTENWYNKIMSKPLIPEELSNLTPEQTIYELITGEEFTVDHIDRNEHTRLAILRNKNNSNLGRYTVNEASAHQFSIEAPTVEEVENNQREKEEKDKWEGKYRKFYIFCEMKDIERKERELAGERKIDEIITSWQDKYINVDTRLLTDMWCGLYVDIWGTSIYIEGETPLLCFAMADKVLKENPPRKDGTSPFLNKN